MLSVATVANDIAVLAVVGGAVVGVVRAEFRRYAAAHPNSPVVRDAETILAAAHADVSAMGITEPEVATFLAGALSSGGLPTTASAVLSAARTAATVAAATDSTIEASAAAPVAPAPTPAPTAPVPDTSPTPPAATASSAPAPAPATPSA